MEFYEYQVTRGPRKSWDGEPDLSKEGWTEVGEWERFDYEECRYWRRALVGEELKQAKANEDRRVRRILIAEAEQDVLNSAARLEAVFDPEFPGESRAEIEEVCRAVQTLQGIEHG